MRTCARAIVALWAVAGLSLAARADVAPLPASSVPAAPTPVGRWRTFDDKTGREKSIVEIWEKDGKLFGKVLTVLHPKEPDPRCVKCEGDLKDARVTGMTMLWDLKKDGDHYTGGRILDPENGKTYKCKVKLAGGGARLEVRGFIGLSLLGRTQTWEREP